jgi:hypothetical protein
VHISLQQGIISEDAEQGVTRVHYKANHAISSGRVERVDITSTTKPEPSWRDVKAELESSIVPAF